LKLYFSPRACSIAPHIILEELDVSYQRELVDFAQMQHNTPQYLAINPAGTVPALWADGFVLTEAHAILTYLGDLQPQRQLLPATGDKQRYVGHEWLNFLGATVHPIMRSVFRPHRIAGDDESACAVIQAHAAVNLAKAITIIESRLADDCWALGEHFSVVDACLFGMYMWTLDERLGCVPQRPKWRAVADKVWARPAVQRVVTLEREIRAYRIPLAWSVSNAL
jgi:glutathione S-transferase